MSTTPMLDRLFANACMSVELGQPAVLRGVTIPLSGITDAVAFEVKLTSCHPELLGADSDIQFVAQRWVGELQDAASGQLMPYPGVWFELTFKPADGSVDETTKQFARALVADYLERRIRAERPDLVALDRQRRSRRRRPLVAATGS